jgi:hypothetical protein
MNIQFPSVIANLPDAEYRAVDAASATTLKTLWRMSAAHAKAQLDGLLDDDDKPELVAGIGTHVAVLQQARFDSEYVIGPDVDLRTKAGKAEWEAAEQANPGKIVLRAAVGESVLAMRQSLWACPEARALLLNATDVELSVFWIDPATGLKCKARADIVCRGLRAMPDLKTATCCKPEKFQFHAWDFGYHIQLSHYWSGLAANDIVIEDAPIIAVEKKCPHPVSVFAPSDDWMLCGQMMRDDALATLKQCKETGVWPGYANGMTRLEVPDRAKWKMVNQTA